MLIPMEVRLAYGLDADEAALDIRHVPSNINLTYIVGRRSQPSAPPLVLQRLHAVFGPSVHIDIQAVTMHLVARGLTTPRLVRTASGDLWTRDESQPVPHVWRALTYVDGVTLHSTRDPAWLESAASLLGAFHAALADLAHVFVHERPLHDTPRHLSNLKAALASPKASSDLEARELCENVLRHAETLRVDFGALPKRLIHGDPKLSNVMFEGADEGRALCMIDLDTVGRGYLAYELGDALRSWCNPAGEDQATASVDPAAFAAVVRGYARTCPTDVSDAELSSAIDGLETVSAELSSRFAADAIQDSYWGWDPRRFASRRDHNLLRARGQLALSRSVRVSRPALVAALDEAARARSVTAR
jgi:Ser/Thr protein kinase RdoA (MazF antagonist)